MIALGIANSSPFIALARIGRTDLIRVSFERLLVPEAVATEIGGAPTWAEVKTVPVPTPAYGFPDRLHQGEVEVILLGIENPGAILLLDDWCAREFARGRGLSVMGTVGLLLVCKRAGRIHAVTPILRELTKAGFYLSEAVVSEAREIAGE